MGGFYQCNYPVWYTIVLPSVTPGGSEAKYIRELFVLFLNNCMRIYNETEKQKKTKPDYIGLKIGLIGHTVEGKYSGICTCTFAHPPDPPVWWQYIIGAQLLLRELILGKKESEESKMVNISILKSGKMVIPITKIRDISTGIDFSWGT